MNGLNETLSAVLITEKKLLDFGLDYLIFSVCQENDRITKVAKFIDGIYNRSHNTTNQNTIRNFEWPGMEEHFHVIFSDSYDGEVIQFHWEEEYFFQIAKIDYSRPPWSNLNNKHKYKYRIQFYGDLFNALRNGRFDYRGLLTLFTEDNEVISSITRLDLKTDISNVSVKEISDGIKGGRLKKVNEFEKDKKTGEMETYYYGKRSKNDDWFARIYDKLAEARKDGHEKHYADYFQFERVTRLELEIRGNICKTYKVDLKNIQDPNFLWSLYAGLLKTKYNWWKILPFLKRKMKKYGFHKRKLEKRIHKPIPLGREVFAKRLVSWAMNFFKRYDINPIFYLFQQLPDLQDEALKFISAYLLTGKSSNQNKLPPKSN